MSEFLRGLDLLWSWILRNIFGYYRGGQNCLTFEEQRPLRVQIKTSSDRTIPLTLEPNWTVDVIKGKLAELWHRFNEKMTCSI